MPDPEDPAPTRPPYSCIARRLIPLRRLGVLGAQWVIDVPDMAMLLAISQDDLDVTLHIQHPVVTIVAIGEKVPTRFSYRQWVLKLYAPGDMIPPEATFSGLVTIDGEVRYLYRSVY